MTRRIAILPDAVADQIAAGEVVERPASVVKELVENALDAGARQVRVTLENGGKTLIQVSDDGTGMGREDAVLALDRHATSKVRSAADLVGVATFGFRGEALPAIASVSRFSLSTNDGETGTELSVTGGRLDRVADAVRQRGTTITVRALFFNTPARRKFLRSAASETRAAQEALATLALAHPEVGFLLEVDATTPAVGAARSGAGGAAGLGLGPRARGHAHPGGVCRRCVPARRVRAAPGRRAADGPPDPAVRERAAVQGCVPRARRRGRVSLRHSSRRPALACSSRSRLLPRTWT